MKVAQLRANQRKERMQKLDIKKLKSQQVHNDKQKGNLYSNNNVNTNSEASVNMNSEASVNMNDKVPVNTNNEVSANIESNANKFEEIDSTDEEVEPEFISSELDCTRDINEWFVELDNEMYEDDDLDTIEALYPADDPEAKWNLNTLFLSSMSLYLSNIEL
ncbi:hypothetical protein F8M41_019939 [Gigaspora margarita]|uniref:Uncharacterized protein n=1 Tax=Gigaspora margarita TaxID=4874 RepID=A0A8H4AJ73_GIGMA|nr:hypothetical protein F8M41_019939 [Gigaspora margarita]